MKKKELNKILYLHGKISSNTNTDKELSEYKSMKKYWKLSELQVSNMYKKMVLDKQSIFKLFMLSIILSYISFKQFIFNLFNNNHK